MYIAYVSSPNWTKINQIHDITNLEISNKLSDMWSWSFSISITNQANNYETLQEFNQIEIYKLDWTFEKKMFEWVIKWALASNFLTTVYIRDYNYLFESKFLESNKNYVWKNPDFIISELLLEINTRYDTGITLDCWITTVLPDKNYSEWQDFYNILKDIANSWYEFKVENKILKFKTISWIDRSISWDNYIEYSYDKDNLDSRSIENPTSEYNADNIANKIKLKDNTTTLNDSDSTSITKYWSVERIFTSSWWNASTIWDMLNERKNSVKEINFKPVSKDFFEVNIWDIVQVYINSQNPLNYYLWTAKIIEKSYRSWDLSIIDIKVSISKVKTLSFLEKFQNMESRIKKIEI